MDDQLQEYVEDSGNAYTSAGAHNGFTRYTSVEHHERTICEGDCAQPGREQPFSTLVCAPWIVSMYWAVCGARICLCVCGVIV
jgi:hypothetical protein